MLIIFLWNLPIHWVHFPQILLPEQSPQFKKTHQQRQQVLKHHKENHANPTFPLRSALKILKDKIGLRIAQLNPVELICDCLIDSIEALAVRFDLDDEERAVRELIVTTEESWDGVRERWSQPE